jgi:HK97 family phage portal protein
MTLWDRVTSMLAVNPAIHERSIIQLSSAIDDYPPLDEQIRNIRRYRELSARYTPSVDSALGVPAIFGAVNLIANIVGSLSMKAMRGEVEIPPEDRPRIIVRPDPFTIPREFYRMTAYNLASRGEAWWWIARRDNDGLPLSVLNVNPAEVIVEEDPDDLLHPIVRWRDRTMENADMRQLVYARDPGDLRGHGPLQKCGAAITVAVEAQEWAANLYGKGVPSLIVKMNIPLGENPDTGANEAEEIHDLWMSKPDNEPRVLDNRFEDVKEFGINEQSGQMLESRNHQNVEVATMFGMDASFLNAAIQGSSVVYQNVGTEFEKFLRKCLRPNYLEVIEQTMSDLLARSTVARFNTDALTLADIKTRYEVYGTGIDKGIIDQDEARRFEGLAPGDVENASVPFSPPQAIPIRLPVQMRTAPEDLRCPQCGRLKGKNFVGSGDFKCERCGHMWAA